MIQALRYWMFIAVRPVLAIVLRRFIFGLHLLPVRMGKQLFVSHMIYWEHIYYKLDYKTRIKTLNIFKAFCFVRVNIECYTGWVGAYVQFGWFNVPSLAGTWQVFRVDQ